MRLWSLHPKYLDAKGLVALWRESLLAKKVLQGKTKGCTKHSQLIRFRNHLFPIKAINQYLLHTFNESFKRGYSFKKNKIGKAPSIVKKIEVNSGQVIYEFNHLKKKLKKRNSDLYIKLVKVKRIDIHPLFKRVLGDVEYWEKT